MPSRQALWACALTTVFSAPVYCADWSKTEVHYQYGNLSKPFQGGGHLAETGASSVLTFQHASGWQYGDNFFFFDYTNFGQTDYDAANNQVGGSEFYGEWYSNFSLGKITEQQLSAGFVKDIGLIAGFNLMPELDTHYYLPGVRLSLDLPGFAFANLDTMAYLQDSPKNSNGVRITENDSWMIDFNFALPFSLGSSLWSLQGHIEYNNGANSQIHRLNNDVVTGKREAWVLAQQQLRLDLGHLLGTGKEQIFGGIEYQYWHNKVGDKNTNESIAQLLLVWRF